MAIAASLTVSPSAPAHGATVTATYVITGNDPVPPSSVVVAGDVVVAGTDFNVSTTITLPGNPAEPVTAHLPTCPGLTFAATGDPLSFTAVVP